MDGGSGFLVLLQLLHSALALGSPGVLRLGSRLGNRLGGRFGRLLG